MHLSLLNQLKSDTGIVQSCTSASETKSKAKIKRTDFAIPTSSEW